MARILLIDGRRELRYIRDHVDEVLDEFPELEDFRENLERAMLKFYVRSVSKDWIDLRAESLIPHHVHRRLHEVDFNLASSIRLSLYAKLRPTYLEMRHFTAHISFTNEDLILEVV